MTNDALAAGVHVLDVDGRPQRYHVCGRGPVCLVHPGGPGLGWEYLRMPGLEVHLTMVYLEPVGTGASARLGHPDEYTVERYAHFTGAVLDRLDAPAPLLLGHSHGGFVAQRYALDHPGRVGGLVLYSTSPLTGPGFWNAAVANVQLFPRRYPDRPAAADIPPAFAAALAADTDETYTAELRRLLPIYLADPWRDPALLDTIRATLRAWVAPNRAQQPHPFDVRAELATLTSPTLVVTGAHDFICGPAWAGELAAAVPRAELVVLGGSGHLAHLEQADAFTATVAAFAR
ncbi:alpha/beta hydrolase [Rugosimonospora acidiphila]|uniref:Alpha/beta hydrolase n=1 Tax=Rugosimonospora acidiphila TaxID=556531 RepID=A0ABP9SCZ5_9ACTN